jgi:hypothetical protein
VSSSPDDRTEELRADARYTREKYELYRARAYGGTRPTSPVRMRELEQAATRARERLEHFERTLAAEATADQPPPPPPHGD